MKEKGFTIVELILTTAIIAALLLVGISNFPQIKLQFSLSRATYQLSQTIRRAQDMALSSVVYRDSGGVTQAVDGYGVFLDINGFGNKKYIIYADKAPGNQQYDASDYLVETIDFSQQEPGIIVKELQNVSQNKASINFSIANVATSITQLNPNQNAVAIVLALESNMTTTRTVLANTSGLIEVQ